MVGFWVLVIYAIFVTSTVINHNIISTDNSKNDDIVFSDLTISECARQAETVLKLVDSKVHVSYQNKTINIEFKSKIPERYYDIESFIQTMFEGVKSVNRINIIYHDGNRSYLDFNQEPV
jgi:hypothetical protein